MKFHRIINNARLPEVGSDGALEIYSAENFKLEYSEVKPFRTGFAVEVPEGMALLIKSTLPMGVKGVQVAGGFVTSKDLTELTINLTNNHREAFEVSAGMQIAVAIVVDIDKIEVEEVIEGEVQ